MPDEVEEKIFEAIEKYDVDIRDSASLPEKWDAVEKKREQLKKDVEDSGIELDDNPGPSIGGF